MLYCFSSPLKSQNADENNPYLSYDKMPGQNARKKNWERDVLPCFVS